MSHAAPGQLEAYNSLQDKHLSGYFNNNRMKKHLVKTGLITKRGKIIDEKTYRLNMAKKEHRKHVRDLLATAILHKALDMERHRQYEIRKRLDDVYKVELVRKVKEERGRKGDEHILPLLTPRERSARRKARKHSRPSTAPAGTLSGSTHPLDIQYDDTTGKPYYTVESGQETAMNTYMKDDDDPNTPYTRAYPGTYPVPAPPPTGTPRRTRPSTSIASRRKTRPHRFHYLAKTEPAIAHRVQLQSMAEVTMKFLGPSLTLTNSMFPEDRLSEVMVVQQHCGGSTLCVFRELLPPNTIFTFISRRHRGSPFGLTFYIDSMQDIRLSSCCEYKHKPGLILGGRNGHFQFVQVEGAAPCYRCQISSGVRSPRDKNQNGQEEDEEENGEKTFITEDEEDNQSFDVIITKVDTNDDEKQDSEEKTNNATQTPRDDQTDESKEDKTEDNKQDSTAEEESRDKDEDEKYDDEDFEDDEDKEKDNDQEDNIDKEEETEAKTDNYKDDFESEHEDPAKESDEEEEEKKKDKDASDSSSSSSSSDSSDSSDDEVEDKKKRKKKKGKKSQDEDVVDKTEENKEQRKEDDNVDKEEEVIDETETKQDKKEEDVHEEDTQYDVVDETEDIKKQKKDDQESQEEDVIDETETKQDDKNEEGDHEEDTQYDVVDETEDSQKEKKDKQDVEKEEQEEDVVDETEVRKEEKKEEEKESEAEDVADETVEKPKDNEQEQHQDGWDVDDDDTQDKQENNDSDSDSEMKRTNRTVSFDEDVKIINNNDNAVDTPSEIPELSEEDTKQSDGVDKSSESKPETNDTEESPTDDVNALEDKEDQGTKDDVDIKPDDSLEVVSPEPPSDSDSSDSSSSDSSDSEDEKDEPNHDPGNDPDSVASEKLPDQALKVIGVQPGAKHEGSIRPLVEDKKDIELTSLLLEPEQIDELVDIIAKRDSVGSITLRNTGITDDSIEKLVTILKPTSVKMLNLNVNKISPTGAGHIANLIKENKSLRMLLLHGNPINDMGVHDILDAIIHTEGTSISNLDLGDCQMGDAGATDIARLLLNNTTVTDLTISGNSIGLSGWRIISSALEQNTTLKSLSLDFSNIRDDEAVILAEGLKENTGLRSLDLEGNKIGDEGGRSLLDAVKVNSTIVDLTLMPINEISKDIYDEIKTILEGRSRTPSRVSSATGSIRSSLSTKEDKPLDEPAPRNDVQETTSRNDDKETTPNETTSSDATQGESKPSTEDDSEQDTEDTAPKTEVSKPEVSTPEESVAEDDVDTPTVTVENGEVYQLVT